MRVRLLILKEYLHFESTQCQTNSLLIHSLKCVCVCVCVCMCVCVCCCVCTCTCVGLNCSSTFKIRYLDKVFSIKSTIVHYYLNIQQILLSFLFLLLLIFDIITLIITIAFKHKYSHSVLFLHSIDKTIICYYYQYQY